MILGKLTLGFGKSHETRKGWGTPAGLEKPGASLEKSWEAWRGMLQDDGGNLRRSRQARRGRCRVGRLRWPRGAKRSLVKSGEDSVRSG